VYTSPDNFVPNSIDINLDNGENDDNTVTQLGNDDDILEDLFPE